MKITVDIFQALNEINASPLEQTDKSIEMVKAVTGMEDLSKMNHKKLAKVCDEIAATFQKWGGDTEPPKPKPVIKANGKHYKLSTDIYQMTAAKYVEAITFGKDAVKNLPKMLATMAQPMRLTLGGFKPIPYRAEDHERVSDDMTKADYNDIFPSLVRFMASLSKISNEYGYLWEGGQEDSGGTMAKAFSKTWGWVYQTKLVSEFEGINLDAAWNMPVIKYLNDLSYLKMKREVDDEYLRKMEMKRK